MNVAVYVDAHMYKTPDGKIWSKTIYSYNFWERYLDVFDEVIIVARIKSANYSEVEGFLECSGERVAFAELPFVQGAKEPWKYIYLIPISYLKIIKIVKSADCGIVRLPSVYGFIVFRVLIRTKKPSAVELVGNPRTVTNDNKLLKKVLVMLTKNSAKKANGVSYVTKNVLQAEYPSTASEKGGTVNYFESYYSSINLKNEYFSTPRNYIGHSEEYVIIHVANHMNDDAKGHKVILDAVSQLINKGYNLKIKFIGDGRKRPEFENYANTLGINDKVAFLGLLSSPDEVREQLLCSDIFVFPSKAEGLPRSLIEAMAVGLPCISSPVGGIPELLEQDCLVPATDVCGYANKLEFFLKNPILLNSMSKRNIDKAMEYRNDVLSERRKEFYSKLRNIVKAI